jgi:pyruvate dehydrogenase E1 component alpha subunit
VYDVSHRACSYDMASETVDGMDALAVHEVMTRAVQRGRTEKLPTLIEARTYRYMGHSMADPIHGHYRTKDELEEQKALDPVEHLRRVLVEAGLLADGDVEAMRAAAEAEVDDAARFAEEAPDPGPDALFTDVYRT